MTGKRSLADLLRNHINEQLKQSFDYSTAFNRKADIEKFIEQNKNQLDKKTSNAKSIRPSHSRALDECLKNKGIDPASLGRKSHKPKFNSDLNPIISPEPQSGKLDSTPPKLQDGKPIPAGGVGVVPVVETFDQKAVSASINSFYLMLRAVYPDLELLTEEEKESLGNLWHTAFNKYFTDRYAEILIPFVATFGMLAPKIIEARKKKKLKKGETIEKKIPDHIQKQADEIKEKAILEEKQQKEKQDNSANQNEQKIKQAVAENDKLPKLGQVSETLTLKSGEKIE